MILIVIGMFGIVTKELVQALENLEIRRTPGDHLNYSIVEIDQNTTKSPGDLKRLAATQTSVENYQLTLVWKTLKWVNNTNNSLSTVVALDNYFYYKWFA